MTRKSAGINPDATPDELFDQLSEQDLEDYCRDLEFLLHADDGKATALYNKFKRGFKNAFDGVKCRKGFIGIKNLRPTQDAIFLRNSIKPVLDGSLTDGMRGGQPLARSLLDPRDSQKISMGFLVVCSVNGVNYIIDGHHRWSRAYMINPGAKMLAYVIQSDGIFDDEDDVLKFAQGEIALSLGRKNKDNHPIDAEADLENDVNMYDASDDDVKNAVAEYLADDVAEAFADSENILRGKTDSRRKIAEYVAGNRKILVENAPRGKHDRAFMPQYPKNVEPGEAADMIM